MVIGRTVIGCGMFWTRGDLKRSDYKGTVVTPVV